MAACPSAALVSTPCAVKRLACLRHCQTSAPMLPRTSVYLLYIAMVQTMRCRMFFGTDLSYASEIIFPCLSAILIGPTGHPLDSRQRRDHYISVAALECNFLCRQHLKILPLFFPKLMSNYASHIQRERKEEEPSFPVEKKWQVTASQ